MVWADFHNFKQKKDYIAGNLAILVQFAKSYFYFIFLNYYYYYLNIAVKICNCIYRIYKHVNILLLFKQRLCVRLKCNYF